MRRRLFTVAAGASAVLCAAVCVLWVRSYVVGYSVRRAEPQRVSELVLSRGDLMYWQVDSPRRNAYGRHVTLTFGAEPPDEDLGALVSRADRGGVVLGFGRFWSGRRHYLLVPCWSLAVAAGVLPAVWLGRRCSVMRRRSRGHCRSCGYDLRATPDRCPECGGVPAAASAKGTA